MIHSKVLFGALTPMFLSFLAFGIPKAYAQQDACTDDDPQTDCTTKVDDDSDGLIEIWNLEQLNNVRYNLAGTGYRTTAVDADGADNTADNADDEVVVYEAGKTYVPGTQTGCPNKDHDEDDGTAVQPTCHGYELMADLDFRDAAAEGYEKKWVALDNADPTAQGASIVASSAGKNPGWDPIAHDVSIDHTNKEKIPTISTTFTGTFDGNKHHIKNLYVNLKVTEGGAYVGLFGYVGTGAVIQNVLLTGEHMYVSVESTHTIGDGDPKGHYNISAGGLAGTTYGPVDIKNCHTTGPVKLRGPFNIAPGKNVMSYAGGLIGAAWARFTLDTKAWEGVAISDCHATGNVNGNARIVVVGGLVGLLREGSTLTDCHATGDVTSESPKSAYAGGLVGASFGSKTNCYATGTVRSTSGTGDGTDGVGIAGGLVGTCSRPSCVIKNSYATGDVSSSCPDGDDSRASSAGGLVGSMDKLKAKVENCYATGDVTSSGVVRAGGLVGSTVGRAVIDNSYATGDVTATNPVDGTTANVGGLLGAGFKDLTEQKEKNKARSTLTSVYHSGTVTGGTESGEGTKKTEVELKTPTAAGATSNDPYHGWSTHDWNFGTSTELPTLKRYKEENENQVAGEPLGGQLSSPPDYSYSSGSATATSFTLTGTAVPAGTARRTFVHTRSMSAFYVSDRMADAAEVGPDGAINFTLSATQGASIVVGTGGAYTGAAALTANTKYYVRMYDYLTSTKAMSGLSNEREVWTLPAAPPAAVLDASQTTRTGAKTEEYTRSDWANLKIHWVLVETATAATTDLDGAKIVALTDGAVSAATTNIGGGDWASAKVKSKGSLAANGTITLSGLTENTGYVLFVVSEGTGTGGQSGSRIVAQTGDGLSFQTLTRYATPVYAKAAHTTTGQVKFTSTNDIPSGAKRRFFLSKGSLAGVSLVTPSDGQLSGGSGVLTFELSSSDRAKNLIVGQGAEAPANLTLDAGAQYYMRAYDYKSDAEHSELSAEVQSDAVPGGATPAPGLAAKADALTQTAQVYTATFASGTLYYLLRAGAKSDEVTKANIKEGTDAVGENKGSVASDANPKEISLSGLSAGTEYTLYAIVEVGGQQSEIATQTFTTASASGGIPTPSYTVGTATNSTIPLTGGSAYRGGADRRRFFVSKEDLDKLVVTDAKEGTFSGIDGDVWSFVLEKDIAAVTIGIGTPEGNKALQAGTRYYVRTINYVSSDGRKSALSTDLGATTTGTALMLGMPRSAAHAYPNPTSGLLHVPMSSGVATVYASDGAKVGTFAVSSGRIDLSGLSAGTYLLRLSDGSVLRVIKQ